MRDDLIREINAHIDGDRAERTQHYFGICKGGYAEKDTLLGIPNPTLRAIAAKYSKLPRADIESLLQSRVHEFRFVALCILQKQYKKNPRETVEVYLENQDETILIKLNQKSSLWRRRISLVAYQAFYRRGILSNGLELIDKRIEDPEDLMHKACGWMLREIYSKVDKHVIESYLIDNYDRLSRTTLRYAIERMPEDERQKYLKRDF